MTVAVSFMAITAAAAARTRARATFSVPAEVNAGDTTAFQWSVSRAPRHARVELQTQVGTAHVWKRLMRLSGTHGTGTLAPHALGRYPLRLVVFARHRILASRNVTLDVFGEVPLGTLLGNEAATYTTSSFTFSYVGRAHAEKYDPEGTAWTISAAHDHCRSAQLRFTVGDAAGTTTETLTGVVSLVQESAEPASVSVSSVPPTVYNLTSTLVPGQSWSVKLKLTSADEDGLILYASFNGVAMCDSAEVET